MYMNSTLKRSELDRTSKTEMLEGRGSIQETDMSTSMRNHAMSCASLALDLYEITDYKNIAAYIKKEFDKTYEAGWQCVVGSKFGCYFTHKKGTFIYFGFENLNFLIFKGT